LKRHYDAIVVGSGAGGGQSAYALCMDGAKVLMLEAGRKYVPETETAMFQTPDQAPLAGEGTPEKPFGFYDATIDGGWRVPGAEYDLDPVKIERQARMIANAPKLVAFANGLIDWARKSGEDMPNSLVELAHEAQDVLTAINGDT